MNRVIHFEIHAGNMERARAFYSSLFDWKFQSWGEAPYWVITTGEQGTLGIDGGMMKRMSPPPESGQPMNGFVNIVEVDDVDAFIRKIIAAGGTLALGKTVVPQMGYSAYFHDTEGNIFGIFQADPAAK